MTGKLLVFWKTSRLGEVVAYERRSQPAVRLYRTIGQSHISNQEITRKCLRESKFPRSYCMT